VERRQVGPSADELFGGTRGDQGSIAIEAFPRLDAVVELGSARQQLLDQLDRR
jgi:hypothetical protein